ncbi:MAG: hypothetical protein ACRCYX_10630 [Dermatophilaceae bacterium]
MSEGVPAQLPASSVLRGVRPYEWDMQSAVRFEVMHEVINDEVGAINGLLYRLEGQVGAEVVRLRAEAEAARERLVRTRRAVRATDAAGIDEALSGARERIAHWNGLGVS